MDRFELNPPTRKEYYRVGPNVRGHFVALLMAVATAACAAPKETADQQHPGGSAMPGMPAGMDMSAMGLPAPVIPAGARYIVADVQFMQGMIAHHGQAVVMAKMAESHGANAQMLRFTQKIALSQRAEIRLMQNWLDERGQAVPDSNAHEHMMMPGMLTAAQLKELDAAKGKAFDKLFLVYMIQHHEGALKMVADLQAAPFSMQDALLNGFATDVDTDQRAEILKMHTMLDAMN